MPRWLAFSLLTILVWGAWGAVSKVASEGVDANTNQVFFTFGLLPLILIVWRSSRNAGDGRGRRIGIAWAFLTGILEGPETSLFFHALVIGGKVSVVSPATALFPLVTVILAVTLLHACRHGAESWPGAGAGRDLSVEPVTQRPMSHLPAWMWFVAIALVFRGITRVTQKLATNRISSELSFILVRIRDDRHLRRAGGVRANSLAYAALIFWAAVVGGTLNGLGALTSFTALESGGKAAVVISLISLYPLLTVASRLSFFANT